MKLNDLLEVELSGAPEGLAQNLRFVAKLCCVVDVLVVAAAAVTEVGASWLYPLKRWRDHAIELGPDETRAAIHDRAFNLLAWQDKWKKDGLAATVFVGRKPRQTIAAVYQLFDFQLQGLSQSFR